VVEGYWTEGMGEGGKFRRAIPYGPYRRVPYLGALKVPCGGRVPFFLIDRDCASLIPPKSRLNLSNALHWLHK
jgi:hypothetical protein